MSLRFVFELPEFQSLAEAVEGGRTALEITGVPEPAKGLVLAALAHRVRRRIVLVRPSGAPWDRLEQDARFYAGELSIPLDLHALPALADSPYLDIPPAMDIVSDRMRFFHDVARPGASPGPGVVFTTLFGLLKPFPAPSDLESFFVRISPGDRVDREALLRTLADFGYAHEDLIASHGEYAWRGGIVDVFSPWEGNPFRLEFSGDEIASLREFDTSTQRSVKVLDRLVIPSLREFPGTDEFRAEWEAAARPAAKGAVRDFEDKARRLSDGETFPSFVYLSLLASRHFVSFADPLRDAIFILDDPAGVEADWEESLKDLRAQAADLALDKTFVLPPEEIYPPDLWDRLRREADAFQELGPRPRRDAFALGFQSVPRFDNRIPFFLDYVKDLHEKRDLCYIYLSNPATRRRLSSLLTEKDVPWSESASALTVPAAGEVSLLLGTLGRGFAHPRAKMDVFAEKDIFTEERVITARAVRRPFVSQFQDLRKGDTVVHTDYGIGLFQGLEVVEVEGKAREFIDIRYRDGDKLLVPVEDLNLVQKFTAAGPALPSLDKLGTATWQKTKARTKKAAEAIARELLELYARRKAQRGYAFSPAGDWEGEFDKTFAYDETEDQLRAIREIKGDMEEPAPMDRLVVGDVGYGKTEVAMRAAFKAIMDGKQVAVLCPTTVLASQHLKTFRERMLLFPVRIEGLTRLQSRKQQTAVIQDLAAGYVDVVIGTHRLLSKDVAFHDLGLLVVDEEQRFGVAHKEKIKQMRASVDVLTLTATPIPRTLNMSLSGLRDISLIETPPRDRLAVHTVVTPWSAKLIASAVRQELARGGQVYYVHNRIEDIDKVAGMVTKLVPAARVVTIHGQMTGPALEKRMLAFVGREANVLVSTTIIENGIDIPLVNTLIVDRADLYGLAQLYQLRGRVGRSSRQAYAYLLVPRYTELTPLARERLKALQEFSELGSGFRLAARDLEIRGAGSFLGHRQHGLMEAVGFDYFMDLLDQTIRELKGEAVEEVKTEINLKADIRVPEDYLPQVNLRLQLYKRLSAVDDLAQVDRIRTEIADRYGPPPRSVENLLKYGAIKFLAGRLKVQSLDRVGSRLVLTFMPATPLDFTRIGPLLRRRSGSFNPQGVMSLLVGGGDEASALDETVRLLKELSDCIIMV